MLPTTLETASAYVAAGLSVAPIRADGTKAPAVAWKEYQQRRPTDAELLAWFAVGKHGIAIICGAVSGNLEVIDFDDLEMFDRWEEGLKRSRSPLLGALPIVATPDNGRHVYYRLQAPPKGNRKIAQRPPTAAELAIDPKIAAVTLIETRGEGGYVLAPGSPLECHPSKKAYRQIGGPSLSRIPVVEGDTL